MNIKDRQLNITDRLILIILIVMGSFGIMGTLISCALDSSLYLTVLGVSVLSAVFCIESRYSFKIRIISHLILFVVLTAIVISKFDYVYQGGSLIIDKVMESISKPYNLNLVQISPAEFMDNADVKINAAIIIITILVTFFVSGIVMSLSGFIAGIFTVAPLLILFISCGVIPDITVILVCVLWSYGMLTKGKGTKVSAQTAVVLIVGAAAILLSEAFVEKDNYIRPQFIENGSDFLRTELNIDMGNTMIGQTGMSNGTLGRFDRLEFSGDRQMRVTVPSIGRTQYFPVVYSYEYTPYDNSWKVQNYKNQSSAASQLADLYGNIQTVRNYIDGGTGNYENLVKTYDVKIDSGIDESIDKEYEGVYIDTSLYRIFENVLNSFPIISGETGNTEYARLYREAKQEERSAVAAGTKIDDTARKTVEDIMGQRSVKTTEEIIAYIDEVKKFLDDNYRYTLSPGHVPEGQDFADYFLNGNKKGYCTYFATAATLMFQAAGIPARYVEGYVVDDSDLTLYGDRQGDYYSYDVTDRAAHAWVEVFIEGVGMVPVEVTPATLSHADIESSQISQQVEPQRPADYAQEVEEQTEPETVTSDAMPGNADSDEGLKNKGDSDNSAFVIPSWVKYFIIIAVITAFAIFAVINIRKYLFRRLIGMRNKGDVIGLYMIFERRLGISGLKKPDDMEYEEYAKFLKGRIKALANFDVEFIMKTVLACRFGNPKDVDREDIKKAAEQLYAILQAFHFQLSREHV